jgi:hypothetical protein
MSNAVVDMTRHHFFTHLRVQFPLWAMAGIAAFSGSPLTAQTTEWLMHKTADELHPDANEQELLWLMNRARANPTAEGNFLAATGDARVVDAINYFEVDLALMRREFAAIPAKPPAAFDRRLYAASLAHSLDLIARDAQDHEGQFERVEAAGFQFSSAFASVFAYAEGMVQCHAGLNIDWGPGGPGGMQDGRGHRAAIMSQNDEILSNVGLAVVPENNRQTEVGPFVFSAAYCHAQPGVAQNYNRFFVGTVWRDANGNQRFDGGEGFGNVRVQPSGGAFHAMTNRAGGFAIPATAGGALTVTFSGGGLPSAVVRQVTVGNESVLVDVEVVPPFAATLVRTATGALQLQWSGGRAPYQVQRASNLSGPWTDVGAAVSTTSATVTAVGPRQFYRVKSS